MGIFGSQGEYAKLAPLFVDKFDTEPTFSKINKGYADGDAQANINATTAMSHEQGLANMIHQKNQEIIRKVNSGEMSPFKYERLTKETAHNYVNDPTRRNVETSYKANEESVKANQNKLAAEGRMQQAQGYHAAVQGGSENAAMTPWSAAGDFSAVDFNSKIANMAAADKSVSGNITLGPAGTFQINKGSHEYITREKIKGYGKQILDSSPDAQAFLEQTSYGDLYNQVYAGLVNNPNTAGLSDKDKKALIYKHLNTPVKQTYEYEVKDKDGKVVKKKGEYMISPLQAEVEKKKEQMISGVSGLASYDKFDKETSLHNIQGYGEGEESETPQTPAGGLVSTGADDIATTVNPYESELDFEEGFDIVTPDAKIGFGQSAVGGKLPAFDITRTTSEEADKKFETTRDKFIGKLKLYGLPSEFLKDKTRGNGMVDIKKAAADLHSYENLHRNQYAQLFDNEQSDKIRKTLINSGGSVVTTDDNGNPRSNSLDIAIGKIADEMENDAFTSKTLTRAGKIKELKDNMEINGLTTYVDKNKKNSDDTYGGGRLAYKVKIGGKDAMIPVKDDYVSGAYGDVNALNVLQRIPSRKEVAITNANTKVSLGYGMNDRIGIMKELGENGQLLYRVVNHTTKKQNPPATLSVLGQQLNDIAYRSLDPKQMQTLYGSEQNKTAGR